MNKNKWFLFLLVAFFACNGFAAIDYWTDAAVGDHNWATAANWDSGVLPVEGDSVYLRAQDGGSDPNGPVIRAGDVVPAAGELNYLIVGYPSGGVSTAL